MPVELIATAVRVYQGLSTDEKPMVGIPIGSRFQELDGDQLEYVFSAESRWTVKEANKLVTETGLFQEQVIDVLGNINAHMAHMTGLPLDPGIITGDE